MAELKTKQNDQSVTAFLEGVADEKLRQDSFALVELMQEITQEPAKMWGDSIIGFGTYHYRYASGREGDMCILGFAPRKQNLALYSLTGSDENKALLDKLGKFKTGKGCLYIKKLEDVDLPTLSTLIKQSFEHKRKVT